MNDLYHDDVDDQATTPYEAVMLEPVEYYPDLDEIEAPPDEPSGSDPVNSGEEQPNPPSPVQPDAP